MLDLENLILLYKGMYNYDGSSSVQIRIQIMNFETP